VKPGPSFALSAMIEADRVELLQGEIESSRRRPTAARARRSPAALSPTSLFGATTQEQATLCALSASEPLMNLTAAARHSHLHPIETAVCGTSAKYTCSRQVLQGHGLLVRGERRAPCCFAGGKVPASSSTALAIAHACPFSHEGSRR
jgi:hypothetical protein